MDVNRRDFLKIAGAGVGSLVLPSKKVSAAIPVNVENAHAMLYDATKCVGCRACQLACKERAGLPFVTDENGMYEMPTDLNGNTWTIIKLYQDEETYSFVKKQCMHCIEPACTSVCPVAALEKTPEGPVVYHGYKCIGCRYCMTACPFEVPKYQWDEVNPFIQKCDFCYDLQAQGQQPACSAACPTGALISGTRAEMLEIAHQRIADNPDKYYDYVYGEHEVGGTSMLYISGVSFDKLQYPELGEQPIPSITWPYMKAVPFVFFGMASAMSAIYYVTHRNKEEKED
ncbi:MAG TPA: hydrogenase 2 operon protein HybA [Brevefilum sp.]